MLFAICLLNHNVRRRTCAPSEDSDQPAHSPSLIRILTWPNLGSKDAQLFHAGTAKTVIRLCACAGFDSSFGVHVRSYVF